MNATIDVLAETYRISSKGCIPIVLRVFKDGKKKIIRMGISVHPEHWDATKNKIKSNCPNKEYLDSIITGSLSKYQKQILEFQSIGKNYSLNQLIEAVDKPLRNISVSEYLESIIQGLMKENRVGNATHYQALYNSLEKFLKINQLQFVDIDVAFLNKYETHLRGIGNKGNTISIKMRTLKAVYNRAVKDNIIKQDYYPFNDYNVSKLKDATRKRSISKEDIQKIIDLDVKAIIKRPQSLIQFSKDLFLFSYLGCGINMVDMAHLRKENLFDNRVMYKRHKTGRQISFL